MHGTLRFLYLSHLLYGICVNIFIMNRYISKSYIHNEQEYFWPTIYRAGAAVVSTITSLIIRSYMMFQRYFVLHDLFPAHCVMKTSHHKKRFNITDLLCLEFPFHNFSIKNKRKLLSITRRKYNIGGNRSVGVSKNSSLYSSRLHLWFSSLQ